VKPALLALCLFVSVAARADQGSQAEARALYEKAIAHYDLAEYDLAITEFKQAYELSREPGLLFNLAQACRLKKDYEQALHFYQTYLELVPRAPNRGDAEAQIAKMKQAIEAAPRPTPAPEPVPAPEVVPPPVAPAPVVTPVTVVAPESKAHRFTHSPRGKATIALAVIGAGALLGAAATGAIALTSRSRYDTGCDAGACDHALYQSGRTTAIITDALIGVGVVAALTATLVGAIRHRDRPIALGFRF
jgi:tetratricopeptide (TPR) repeat protein